ncbi:hypothetical protein [Microlunatus ginsengisoli]|uniref:Uncharacterized protein n=1 Tax=Microlunatus ginsengisoli TaxID=363863 RepID=A0ABP7ALT0_9ACTN
MSDLNDADLAPTGGEAGGTPSESDLPSMQGLGDSVDDPSDPTAARDDDAGSVGDNPAALLNDDEGPSDPMPDMSGTSGSQ